MKIIPTSDGSVTIYNSELDETYHSVHGAIQEAKHVFIEHGLKCFDKKEIKILEVGLGTGLNLFLTFLFSKENQKVIHYTALEPYPISTELTGELNYLELLDAISFKETFTKIHLCSFNVEHELTDGFKLKKINTSVQEWIPKENDFDLIYFDAFGPRAQADMWTIEIFEKLFSVLNSGGMLLTYCAKGEVKRSLKAVGFKVESLPGPPGKREMTRAVKI